MQMWEYGLISHWYSRYRGRYEQCIVQPLNPRMSALKLEHLYSAFLLLIFGICISLVVFMGEQIIKFVTKECYQNTEI
jgi:hypothetical protein